MFVLLVISVSLEMVTGFAAGNGLAGLVPLSVFAIHWFACALFAYGAARFTSQDASEIRGGDAVLFFSLGFFVPALGMIGVCSLLPAFRPRSQPVTAPRIDFRTADAKLLPDAPPQSPPGPGAANPGMLVSALRHSPDPSRRAAAILATLRLPDQDAINILRVALGDSEDDIRLLAYALLAQMDKRYNDSIQAALGQLRDLPPDKAFLFHKQIAQQYWELAWVGLARGESVAPILRKALDYACAGLSACPKDAGLLLLHGKILLRLKRYDEAYDSLAGAELSGMDMRAMAPYMAEISFFRRQFTSVVGHMERAGQDLRSSVAAGVRSYWRGTHYAA